MSLFANEEPGRAVLSVLSVAPQVFRFHVVSLSESQEFSHGVLLSSNSLGSVVLLWDTPWLDCFVLGYKSHLESSSIFFAQTQG